MRNLSSYKHIKLFLLSIKSIFLVFILSWAFSARLSALELYSFIEGECKAKTGIIIYVNKSHVYQIDTKGELNKISREDIKHILVYNVLDNPIYQLKITAELKELTREVHTSSEKSFSGWPIRFLEDLIVFWDTEGKNHLVNIDTIQSFISSSELFPTIKKIEKFKKIQFGLGKNLPECSNSGFGSESDVLPTRMLSDKMRISKFLTIYQNGFRKLNRLQKRTFFYARPYLYDKQTKVAFVIQREDFQEELSRGLPLYFIWPSGSTFGPQGSFSIGNKTVELVPNVEPVFAMRFDGKYHFLSVSFAGNLNAFSMGNDFIIKNRFSLNEFFSRKQPDETLFLSGFNQIALTGFEWKSFSAIAGFFYPFYGIQANGIMREILSTESSTILGFQYTEKSRKYQILLSDIHLSSNNPVNDGIKLIYANEMTSAGEITSQSTKLATDLESFDFRNLYLRFNYTWDINKKIRFEASEVISKGVYDESISGNPFELSFDQFITTASIQQSFGNYVSLKGSVNYFIRQYHSKTLQHETNTYDNKFSFSMAIEFIL